MLDQGKKERSEIAFAMKLIPECVRMFVCVTAGSDYNFALLTKNCFHTTFVAAMFTFDLICASPSILYAHISSQSGFVFLSTHYRFLKRRSLCGECVLEKPI